MQVINPIIRSSLKCELPIRLLRRNTSTRKTTENLPVAVRNAPWRPVAGEKLPAGANWRSCQGLQHNQTILNRERITFKHLMGSARALRRSRLWSGCWEAQWCLAIQTPVLPFASGFRLALVGHWGHLWDTSLGQQCSPWSEGVC